MIPGSSTESYPAFARNGLRENPGKNLNQHRKLPSICSYWVEGKPRKNLNQVTCSDRDSNPGHLVSRPDALTVTPQRLVKCFVWSVALYGAETWTLRRSEETRIEVDMRRMECVKRSSVEKSGSRKNDPETDQEEESNWLNHWLTINCLLRDALEGMVNWRRRSAEDTSFSIKRFKAGLHKVCALRAGSQLMSGMQILAALYGLEEG
ncbi:hypothetical protein ANN_09258 [Periplaneta americana]|uniref:Uncharacterized protein n=1 Tax=Periplaneta americana TaxID=6978 RepID=A0ABQ8TL88_PERAM|nr:hypothetical protein ANN_09258 [Periplaneta americana]